MSTLTIKLDSQNHWVADGSQTVWNFEFSDGYINRTHVRAYQESNAPVPVRTELVIDPDTSFVGDYQLLVSPAVPAGYTFVIYRATPKDKPLVDFQDGGGVTELNLDTMSRQSVMLAQESADFLGVTTTADLQDLAQTALASAGAAAASAATAATSASNATLSAASALTFANNAGTSATSASASAANAASAANTAVNTFGSRLSSVVAPASNGAGMIGYNDALAYAAGTVGFYLNRKKMVIATGVAATDTAALNAAIAAAPARSIITLYGTFLTNASVLMKPDIILEGESCEVLATANTYNIFEFINPSPAGYPGRIGFRNMKITGVGNSGTTVGIYIDSNTPFVGIDNCFITSMFGGILLRDCYDSTISNTTVAVCARGISLYRESHAVKLDNNFVDGCSVYAAAINYGSGAGSGPTHNVNVIGGAYQNSPVGIWAEQTLGLHTTGVYHEGNSVHDYRIGVGDAGVYGRACYNTTIDGFESASPCAGGINIRIEHSVGVEIYGAAWNSGCSTTAPLISYDAGFSDRVSLHIHRYSTLVPTATAPVDFTSDPTRGVVWYRGRPMFGIGQTDSVRWGDLSNTRASLGQTQPGGRNQFNLTSVLDTVLKIGNAGLLKVQDTAGTDWFQVDLANGKIILSKPLEVANQAVATTVGAAGGASSLPATPLGYMSVVINGTSRKIPYYTS